MDEADVVSPILIGAIIGGVHTVITVTLWFWARTRGHIVRRDAEG